MRYVTDAAPPPLSGGADSTAGAAERDPWLLRWADVADTARTTMLGGAIIVTCGCAMGDVLLIMVSYMCPP
jgi:hypothetical protein